MNERANPNNNLMVDLSPKDIKHLEVLKPHSTPGMSRRHKECLDKEKRLQAANRPLQNNIKQAKTADTKNVERKILEKSASTKTTTRNNKLKREKTSQMPDGRDTLDQDDAVEDFVNWSDDE
jgi:hypothetical protein